MSAVQPETRARAHLNALQPLITAPTWVGWQASNVTSHKPQGVEGKGCKHGKQPGVQMRYKIKIWYIHVSREATKVQTRSSKPALAGSSGGVGGRGGPCGAA